MGKHIQENMLQLYCLVDLLLTAKSQFQEIRKEIKKGTRCRNPPPDIMTKRFQPSELNRALHLLKKKKSPGPDEITNELIKHLGPVGRARLLQLFNHSWEQSVFPEE